MEKGRWELPVSEKAMSPHQDGRSGLFAILFLYGGEAGALSPNSSQSRILLGLAGTAPFDLRSLMMSEEKLYAYYGHFFKQPAPFHMASSFVKTRLMRAAAYRWQGRSSRPLGRRTDLDDMTITLAHEMLHTFVGGIEKPEGLLGSWYSEGLAVYYARLLSLRAGQITPAQFLKI